MKSTTSEAPCTRGLPYPKLMVLKHRKSPIVLFSASRRGVCVHPGGTNNLIGDNSDDWLPEENWKDFHGSVCLENDKA